MNGFDPPRPKSRSSTILLMVIFGVGILVGFSVADVRRRQTGSVGDELEGERLIRETLEAINADFVNAPMNRQSIIRGAAEGIVRSLGDEYSFYLNPDEAQSFEADLNGKFDGIGAELGVKDERIVVIAPLAESPAAKAGLLAGDTIVSVDNVSTDGQTLGQVVQRIRGPSGSVVKLRINRQSEPQELSITRDTITVESLRLTFETIDQSLVAVITLSSFTESTDQEFSDALHEITLRQPRAVLLDVRNNPGGFLSSAVTVVDAFVSDGSILIEEYSGGNRRPVNADQNAPLGSTPVGVLVNGGTASASEIVAAALRERRQAPIYGQQTFGKGTVQELKDLHDGSVVKLTVARWLTPSGQSIDRVGITPTREIPSDSVEADDDRQRQQALEALVESL